MTETYTNSSLTTFRRCPREYELRYVQRLELDTDHVSEPLSVGHTWHRAFDAMHKAGNDINAGFSAISDHAPSHIWGVKLERLFAAYHWYWKDQPLELEETEVTFKVRDGIGNVYEGQRDGIMRDSAGRKIVLERKTTGDDISDGSSYWDRLRLDVQVGLYSLSLAPELPSGILYDVVRKPTINPKRITKADGLRLRRDLGEQGQCNYFQELFTADEMGQALEEMRESPGMYGARLTADIGDRPEFYFSRRPVDRTRRDFEELLADLEAQVDSLENAHEVGFHRNPDSCNAFGRCAFFSLCSSNDNPSHSDLPDGYRRREHTHPELQ